MRLEGSPWAPAFAGVTMLGKGSQQRACYELPKLMTRGLSPSFPRTREPNKHRVEIPS